MVQLVSIDDVAVQAMCKVSDGNVWVNAVFHRQYTASFQTGRLKENQLLRLINCSLDGQKLQIV